tara:strand:+ start:78758 stop:78991 length:234 start_codon:yes stop_codon:yes gene_type:complete
MILVGTLFTVVFFKMEIRRMGYVVWKLSRAEKIAEDTKNLHKLEYARLTRPERIEAFAANFFSLKKAEHQQVVYMED